MTLPSQSYLNECFAYDKKFGNLAFKSRPITHFDCETKQRNWNARFAGKVTGCIFKTKKNKYKIVCVNGKNFYAHRIIWKMHNGEDPRVIDHANGNGLDNRIENLINGDYTQNNKNRRLTTRSKYGCFGVRPTDNGKKWKASIAINASPTFLGVFDTFEDAVNARLEAQSKYGYSEHHGTE